MTHIPLIICIAFCGAFGLTILLSACKAAGRNPLEFTSAVQPETKSYSAGLCGSAGARDSISVMPYSHPMGLTTRTLPQLSDDRYCRLLCLECGKPWNSDSQDLYLCDECYDSWKTAWNKLSSIGTGVENGKPAQGPHPRISESGNSASELLHADARNISPVAQRPRTVASPRKVSPINGHADSSSVVGVNGFKIRRADKGAGGNFSSHECQAIENQ